jgi:hypothetical protein
LCGGTRLVRKETKQEEESQCHHTIMIETNDGCDRLLTCLQYIGGCQEAYPPCCQEPACHRWCFPRRDQGAPLPAPRGP